MSDESATNGLGMRCGAATWLLRTALQARHDGARPASVLVVEDEAATRRMFATFLRRRGFEVLEAEHGHHALALARRSEPDIIVLDLRMPVLDGLTTAELLKLDATTAHIPLVAVTGHSFEGGVEEAKKFGFAAYLPKPLEPEDLAAAIADLLDSAETA